MSGEYASAAQLKAWIAVPATDITRDDVLQLVLASASRWVDRYCRRRFYLDTTATQRSYPARGDATELLVDDIGSLTGLVVDSGSALAGYTALVATAYAARPANALALGLPVDALAFEPSWTGFPAIGGSGWTTVRVTARWGWPVVPDEVAQATLIQAARLFKRKDSPEGVLGSADWGAIRLSRVDPDVESLLAPYRLLAVA